jgi:quinol monooxygenase YgiN
MMKKISFGIIVAGLLTLLASFIQEPPSNSTNRMERIAKIKVDPKQLEAYHKALKEQMQAAIEKEPGVLSYYAVADKKDPSSITIFEIYAKEAAYKTHITTPHFLAYKEVVKNMVQSLELQDVTIIANAKKPGI